MLTDLEAMSSKKMAARQFKTVVAAAALLVLGCSSARADSSKLEGQVEETGVMPSTQQMPAPVEPMPVPVLKPSRQQGQAESGQQFGAGSADKLHGGARTTALQGHVESGALGHPQTGRIDDPNRLNGTADKDDPALKAAAAGADPDADDEAMMVEWDRWRNRFLHAVQSGMQELLNNPTEETIRWDPQRQAMVSKFPMGTIAWFSCQITPDQKVQHIKLLHSSGFPVYDRAVLDAIDQLQGSSILRYPRGSKRSIVTQIAGIKTAETSEYRNFHFGDVERQRVPHGDGF
jgi:hypothetical protein